MEEQPGDIPPTLGIKELAHAFFSESFVRKPVDLPIAASLEKLMQDTDATSERLLEFLTKIEDKEDGPTVLPISSPGGQYNNDSIGHRIQL